MSTTFNEPDINPYAAPVVGVGSRAIPDSPGFIVSRLSGNALQKINRYTCAADCFYFLSVVCWMMMFAWFTSYMFQQYVLIAYAVVVFVLWFSTCAASLTSKNYAAAIAAVFVLPIPLLGTLIFLVARLLVKKTMINNGYRPRLIGFALDEEERKAMDADPLYYPSEKFHIDGSKRSQVYSLGECTLFLPILCLLAFVATS